MKSPAFLLYTGDFLSSLDVQLMEAHEVGAYCLLLFNSCQSDRPGFLPNDEDRLRRIARLTAEQWASSRQLLLRKFPTAPTSPPSATTRAWPPRPVASSSTVSKRPKPARHPPPSAPLRQHLLPKIQHLFNTCCPKTRHPHHFPKAL
ncbi:MAG: DUF1376 domain-containing protein [Janthinobacterium lividum]